MTCQGQKTPKTRYNFCITNENYDFLYRLSKQADSSIARALNRVITEARRSDTTSCNSESVPQKMEMRNYAR